MEHTLDKPQEHREDEEAQERRAPAGKIVYKAILDEGEEELSRSSPALFWSGLAAGLAMGLSMAAEGILMARLPDAEWAPLVAKLGYCFGFVVVILGRQQLFTENTLTPILPLLQKKRGATVANVLRLWGVVLAANFVGALLFAMVAAHTSAFDEDVRSAFRELGTNAMSHDFMGTVIRGVFAGWLIALIVWMLPFAETARLWVIVLVTWLVGVGEFAHIIAGSVETFTLAATGDASWGDVVARHTVPTLIGNIVGGIALVAALNHGQVTAGNKGL